MSEIEIEIEIEVEIEIEIEVEVGQQVGLKGHRGSATVRADQTRPQIQPCPADSSSRHHSQCR